MFETVIAAMLKHKQMVFAAIAVTALIGYIAPPAVQVAQAQSLGEDIANSVLDSVFGGDDGAEAEDDDENGDGVDQDLDQELDQDQDADQDVDQTSDQSETNVQANDLRTGDNTAVVSQSNDAAQEVSSAAAAEAEAESETEGGDGDDRKKKKHSYDGGSGGTASETIAAATATSTATGVQDQDNTANIDQDSRIHDVDLSNTVEFGDDTNEQIAIPIIDQDQRAANLAAQLGIDFDFDNQYGYAFTDGDDD